MQFLLTITSLIITASTVTTKPVELRCLIDSAEPGYKISVLILDSNDKTVTQEWKDGYKETNLAVFRNQKVTWNAKMDDDLENKFDISTNKLDLETGFLFTKYKSDYFEKIGMCLKR
tara:strand:- start:495 stop:845 length:351 start_codon:yes stop_codon:yes gene_type:complete